MTNTWQDLCLKHNYDLPPKDLTAVVVCRGQSAEYFEKGGSYLLYFATEIFEVNNWEGIAPNYFLKYREKLTTFVNDRHRNQYFGKKEYADIGFIDAVVAQNTVLTLCPNLAGIISKIWSTGDCGLKAIVYASTMNKTVIIGGLDFWESNYWKRPDHEKRRSKGSRIQDKCIELMLDYVLAKENVNFQFYTLSKKFYERSLQTKSNNLLVRLIQN
jgi:hypothetical protein